ncbi:MoxR family ATPase [Micromonospora peucetia]|uniref:AAA family ATPase n=1 Tax=Micromonospora peucetia TaxID=47871 RepID=UPI00331B426E
MYAITDNLKLAVDVALATGRPLLLRGEPGSGKSSLAAYVARQRTWRYYEHIVTSRTEARDLLWTFDAVRKLADAQSRSAAELDDHDYVEPGVLWWAFAPRSALGRGWPGDRSSATTAKDPQLPVHDGGQPSVDHAVVLIDEIDKSEPDLPNNLLVPLGSHQFTVTDIRTTIRKEAPAKPGQSPLGRYLIVVTTNEERPLPEAFLRRCVVAVAPRPDKERLVAIARLHLETYEGGWSAADLALANAIAADLLNARSHADRDGFRAPSTAEFLDALRACRSLGITVDSPQWDQMRQLVMVKPGGPWS